ncbi:hypothetical protein [Actinophytocola gossypii]|uniref:Uncharacterized protein n=1 Tax=Actinophytocola gossypii TaxID=2812003 RepID=A0ABT2J8Z3_9PSEU|nr:hypothetical protein [Actinophytocola gossypii]MCT2584332.1 hypothetical protein [Actinophytocola gossypii]
MIPFDVTVLSARPDALSVDRTVCDVDGSRFAVRLDVTCVASEPVVAGLRVSVRLGETDDPGWLVPGAFYGENRVAGCRVRYPRFTRDAPDPALLESAEWGLRADRCATPAVFAWDREGGAALVTTEWSPLGQAGVGLAMDGEHPVLRLHFPYREEPVVYDGSPNPLPADTPAFEWYPGRTETLRFDLHVLGPDRHAYAGVLCDLHRRTAPVDADTVPWVSVEDAAALTAWGLYRWHYVAEDAVLLETAAFDRHALGEHGDRQAMHVSWISGVPYAYALLRHGRRVGNDSYVDAATAVLDNIANHLTPGGTFWGQWTRANGWNAGWTPDRRRVHARTLGEATLFLTRAVALGGPPQWRAAVVSNLDVAVKGQAADGSFGAGYDVATGEVLDRNGTSGLAWIPALVEAAALFDEPRYLDAARRAGRFYAGAVEREFLYGAPEDVDLAPSSEDGYLAIMAYVSLYEADGADEWLALARRAADWTLTFRYTYDVDFPPHTLLGHYDFRSRGADQASPANQHLHSYGLICAAELARLGEHTGETYYTASAEENLACFRQFVARADGDFNAYRGMVSERFYQTACYQPKGMLLTLSHAWCVGVLLLACEARLG